MSDEIKIVTPSAETQGSEREARDICERLDAILIEEDRMHPIGCASWEEEARIAIDMAKDALLRPAAPLPLGAQYTTATDFPGDDVLAYTDAAPAPVALVEHFRAMQRMATAYLVPEDYRDRNGDVTLQGTEHNSESYKWEQKAKRAIAFANDMIYMLDGPEERAALTAGAEPRATDDRLSVAVEALEEIVHSNVEMVGTPVDTEAANAWAMTLSAAADRAATALRQIGSTGKEEG